MYLLTLNYWLLLADDRCVDGLQYIFWVTGTNENSNENFLMESLVDYIYSALLEINYGNSMHGTTVHVCTVHTCTVPIVPLDIWVGICCVMLQDLFELSLSDHCYLM